MDILPEGYQQVPIEVWSWDGKVAIGDITDGIRWEQRVAIKLKNPAAKADHTQGLAMFAAQKGFTHVMPVGKLGDAFLGLLGRKMISSLLLPNDNRFNKIAQDILINENLKEIK